MPRPVNIYDLVNLSLLIKAFSCEEYSKHLNWGRLLLTNKLSPDYMYHIINLCTHFPVYRAKQRILTSVNRYLTNMGMVTSNTFPLKTFRSIQQGALKRWVKETISCHNPTQVHLKKFLTLRSRVLTVPYENWNLRLRSASQKRQSTPRHTYGKYVLSSAWSTPE